MQAIGFLVASIILKHKPSDTSIKYPLSYSIKAEDNLDTDGMPRLYPWYPPKFDVFS